MTESMIAKCRICGFTGPKVSVGVWKSAAGKYHVINRCEDHLACDSRKPAKGSPPA